MSTGYTEPSGLNRFWLGFLLGLGFPVIFFLLYFLFRFHDISIGHYFDILMQSGKIVHVLSLAVFPNLIPFMLFVRTNRFKSGRGVMAITIIYGLLIFALKFSL
jgi:hypothetical protein